MGKGIINKVAVIVGKVDPMVAKNMKREGIFSSVQEISELDDFYKIEGYDSDNDLVIITSQENYLREVQGSYYEKKVDTFVVSDNSYYINSFPDKSLSQKLLLNNNFSELINEPLLGDDDIPLQVFKIRQELSRVRKVANALGTENIKLEAEPENGNIKLTFYHFRNGMSDFQSEIEIGKDALPFHGEQIIEDLNNYAVNYQVGIDSNSIKSTKETIEPYMSSEIKLKERKSILNSENKLLIKDFILGVSNGQDEVEILLYKGQQLITIDPELYQNYFILEDPVRGDNKQDNLIILDFANNPNGLEEIKGYIKSINPSIQFKGLNVESRSKRINNYIEQNLEGKSGQYYSHISTQDLKSGKKSTYLSFLVRDDQGNRLSGMKVTINEPNQQAEMYNSFSRKMLKAGFVPSREEIWNNRENYSDSVIELSVKKHQARDLESILTSVPKRRGYNNYYTSESEGKGGRVTTSIVFVSYKGKEKQEIKRNVSTHEEGERKQFTSLLSKVALKTRRMLPSVTEIKRNGQYYDDEFKDTQLLKTQINNTIKSKFKELGEQEAVYFQTYELPISEEDVKKTEERKLIVNLLPKDGSKIARFTITYYGEGQKQKAYDMLSKILVEKKGLVPSVNEIRKYEDRYSSKIINQAKEKIYNSLVSNALEACPEGCESYSVQTYFNGREQDGKKTAPFISVGFINYPDRNTQRNITLIDSEQDRGHVFAKFATEALKVGVIPSREELYSNLEYYKSDIPEFRGLPRKISFRQVAREIDERLENKDQEISWNHYSTKERGGGIYIAYSAENGERYNPYIKIYDEGLESNAVYNLLALKNLKQGITPTLEEIKKNRDKYSARVLEKIFDYGLESRVDEIISNLPEHVTSYKVINDVFKGKKDYKAMAIFFSPQQDGKTHQVSIPYFSEKQLSKALSLFADKAIEANLVPRATEIEGNEKHYSPRQKDVALEMSVDSDVHQKMEQLPNNVEFSLKFDTTRKEIHLRYSIEDEGTGKMVKSKKKFNYRSRNWEDHKNILEETILRYAEDKGMRPTEAEKERQKESNDITIKI